MTAERLEVLREADAIVVNEIKAAGLYRQTAQAFAVLLPPAYSERLDLGHTGLRLGASCPAR